MKSTRVLGVLALGAVLVAAGIAPAAAAPLERADGDAPVGEHRMEAEDALIPPPGATRASSTRAA